MFYSIAELNQMSQTEFVACLGTVFEHTPAIAERAWLQRPFPDLEQLHQACVEIINSFSESEKIALIQAHPDLGSKAKMADDSVQEQSGVGLDRLSLAEYELFQMLNQNYKQKFGFPFIIAVKNHTKQSILEAFEQRLHNSIAAEQQQALLEITQIAKFRLMQRVSA